MASDQEDVGIVARPGAAMSRRLSTELSELLHEVRDISSYARRAGLAAVQCGDTSYEEALDRLFEGWMRSTSRRRQVLCFASAAELGVLLGHHHEWCKGSVDVAGILAWRALFWVASRRMSWPERQKAPVSASLSTPVKTRKLPSPCADYHSQAGRVSMAGERPLDWLDPTFE